jgi:hypothetical protein
MEETFDHLRNSIRDYLSDSAQAGVCVQIIDALALRRRENLKMLTYQSFSKMTERSADDPILIMAVQFFTTSSSFRLFEMRYLVVDEEHPDGTEISNSVVANAYNTGTLELPDGHCTADFENFLLPYFTASPELDALKVEQCQGK